MTLRSRLLPGLLVIALACAVAVPRASAQLALPGWMRVRSAPPTERAVRAASVASSPERDEAVWRSSWILAIGSGLLVGSATGAAFGIAKRCRGDGMSFAVPLSAVVGTAGLVLTFHGAVGLSRLRKQQPLPRGVAKSVVPKSVAFAAATAGLLIGAAVPHIRGCRND